MDKLKQWVALTAVGVLAILAAGWFLLVSPRNSEAADIRAQAASQEGTNKGLQQKLDVLKAQSRDLPAQQAVLAAVAAKIPNNPALPSLIRSLTKAAADTGVELVSIAPGAPTELAAPAAAQVAPAATPDDSTTGTGAKQTPRKKAAPAVAVPALKSIGLQMSVVGGYFQVEQFLDRLENLSRALKVSNLAMTPGVSPIKPAAGADAKNPSTLSVSIAASVYMAASPAAPAATVPAK